MIKKRKKLYRPTFIVSLKNIYLVFSMDILQVSEEIKKELIKLKDEEGEENLDSLLKKIITLYKKYKLLKVSALLKRKLEEKGISPDEIALNELLVVEFETKKSNSSC
mgnify:CR=1 FL=1